MCAQRNVRRKRDDDQTVPGAIFTATRKRSLASFDNLSHASKLFKTNRQSPTFTRDTEKLICYVNDDVPIYEKGARLLRNVSVNVVDFLNDRQLGNTQHSLCLQSLVMGGKSFQCQPDLPIRHLVTNNLLQEKIYSLENLDKIFCSQWLSDREVIFGTKCNNLMVLDVKKSKLTNIPTLTAPANDRPIPTTSGIHTIQINPSRTLVATGGKSTNDIGIYNLEQMEPFNLGQLAHQEWISSLAWLTDDVLVSGSYDSKIALWNVFEQSPNATRGLTCINASIVKRCQNAEKIRDLVFNRRLNDISCVSANGYLHTFGSDNLIQKYSKKLPFTEDVVCISVHEDYSLYAVGSKSHLVIFDAKDLHCVAQIKSRYPGCGIRSINFHSTIITIGSGKGEIAFFDLRAGKYLSSEIYHSRYADLKCSNIQIVQNEINEQLQIKPAIFTHCLDETGTRLFVAGGPHSASYVGNYVSLWQ